MINGRPTLTEGDGTTSFGIGIGDYPVHPIDQAVGFATIANGGIANKAYFVQRATASDGHVVYRHKTAPKRALDSKVANDVTLTLEPIAAWSGVALADGRPSAAKTGTEGIQSGKYTGDNSDAWMVGFTPQVSAAVWVGSGNSTRPVYDAYGGPEYGRDLPGRAWKIFMDSWLAGKPVTELPSKQLIGAPVPKPTRATSSAPAPSHSAAPSTPTPSPSSSTTPTPSPSSSSTPSPSPTPSPSLPPVQTCTPGSVLTVCTSTTPAPPQGSAPASP
jgi:membrane peptidoglycan carboxypeptidase